MNRTDSRAADLACGDYVAEMTGALASVAADASAFDLRPCYLQVSHNALDELVHNRPWRVSVQFDSTGDVDVLADHYSLPVDDGTQAVYTRNGVATLTDETVTLNLYSRRPADDTAQALR